MSSKIILSQNGVLSDHDITLSKEINKMVWNWRKKMADLHTSIPVSEKECFIKYTLEEHVNQGYDIAKVLKSEFKDSEIYYYDMILHEEVLVK